MDLEEKRFTIKLKHPNPLFEQWLTEWYLEAKSKDSKLQYSFQKALKSLKQYPLPLKSGKECGILKGFGTKMCIMLDRRLIEYKKENLKCNNSTQGISTVRKSNSNKSKLLHCNNKPNSNNDLITSELPNSSKEKKRRKNLSPKNKEENKKYCEYIPKYKSGAYAILLTLYEKSFESDYPGFMLKTEIIKHGQHLSDKSFTRTEPQTRYTAWSSMKTLLAKNLVSKQGNPAKFSLTDEGASLAFELQNNRENKNGENCSDDLKTQNEIYNLSSDEDVNYSAVPEESGVNKKANKECPENININLDKETNIESKRRKFSEKNLSLDEEVCEIPKKVSNSPSTSFNKEIDLITKYSKVILPKKITSESDAIYSRNDRYSSFSDENTENNKNEIDDNNIYNLFSNAEGRIIENIDDEISLSSNDSEIITEDRHGKSLIASKIAETDVIVLDNDSDLSNSPTHSSSEMKNDNLKCNKRPSSECSDDLPFFENIHKISQRAAKSNRSRKHLKTVGNIKTISLDDELADGVDHLRNGAGKVTSEMKSSSIEDSRKFTENSEDYSTSNSNSQRSTNTNFDDIIFQPNCFEIILLVDISETSGFKKSETDTIHVELKRKSIKYEVRRLNIGDFIWIARNTSNQELVLPYIVERKRMDDLGSSIKDGRFHEQKFRLKQSGIQNLIYLIESYGNNQHVGLPLSTLQQAAANTQVQGNFIVKFTDCQKHSLAYLSIFTEVLENMYLRKILTGCAKNDLIPINPNENDIIPLMTFSEFNKASTKSKNVTVRELFMRQLVQIKGVSVEKAMAITEKYPTPFCLYSEYTRHPSDTAEKLLSKIQYQPAKCIGLVISKTIYQLYSRDIF